MARIIRLISDCREGPVVDIRANGKVDGKWRVADISSALKLIMEYPDYIAPPRGGAIVAVVEDKGFGSESRVTFKLATSLGSESFCTMPLAQAAALTSEALRDEIRQAGKIHFEKNRNAAHWLKIVGIFEYFSGPPLSSAGT